jgi:hypothetical protein
MKNLYRFEKFLLEADKADTMGDFVEKFSDRISSLGSDLKKQKEESDYKVSDIPFKDNTEGNAFRKWVNEKDPTYSKSIDLSSSSSAKDGYKNDYIKKAWEKYGEEYAKSLSEKSSEIPFKNKEEGDEFRKWVRKKDKDYSDKIVLSETGPYNNDTIKKAWEKYGKEYQKEKDKK